jgi:5-carboxymethyl-2-hydroxymuconate isomerase
MPHCILEASDNLLDQPEWSGLLRAINRALVDTGLFKVADIKSRYLCHGIFAIGDGEPGQAFVTLNVQILEGRPDAVKASITEALLPILAEAFPRTLSQLKCSLTVQITDIHRPSYRRQVSS